MVLRRRALAHRQRSPRLAEEAPTLIGVAHAMMTGNLPVDKHIVGDVDSTPREGDAAV
jgi:hypothetical protein